MAAEIITTDDLRDFKRQLLHEMDRLLKKYSGQLSKKYLKSYKVRKLLGLSPGSLQNLRVTGTLPYSKIGGTIGYDYEDILKMMVDNRSQIRRRR